MVWWSMRHVVFAMSCAVSRLSPVSIHTLTFAWRSACKALGV
jgi:hypothetical protein